MDVIHVYKCLCDRQRLRILNLLRQGPLCVCHLMEILSADQVKISKQLRYLKQLGLVESSHQAQWRVYRLVEPPSALLVENLKCLQDLGGESLHFKADLRKLQALVTRLRRTQAACPPPLDHPPLHQSSTANHSR
ncbi:MAG: ArsR/SmtB family transcription factor [Opitutales bacterium]